MSWTATKVWTTGYVVTAADLNTYLSDNTDYLKGKADLFDAMLGARVYDSTGQSIANNSWQNVVFDSEFFDDNSFHDVVSNTDRLTVAADGVYLVLANLKYNCDPNGIRRARISINDSGWEVEDVCTAPNATYTNPLQCTSILKLSSGDYVTFQTYQNRGSALTLDSTTDDDPQFAIFKLGVA